MFFLLCAFLCLRHLLFILCYFVMVESGVAVLVCCNMDHLLCVSLPLNVSFLWFSRKVGLVSMLIYIIINENTLQL